VFAAGFARAVQGVLFVSAGDLRVMRTLLVIAGSVLFGGFAVMLGRLFMGFGRFSMMVSWHNCLLFSPKKNSSALDL